MYATQMRLTTMWNLLRNSKYIHAPEFQIIHSKMAHTWISLRNDTINAKSLNTRVSWARAQTEEEDSRPKFMPEWYRRAFLDGILDMR